MPAPDHLTPSEPADERTSLEPSMEEILASIRRIISDDQSLPATREQGRTELNMEFDAPTPPAGSSKWPYANAQRNETKAGEVDPAEQAPVSPGLDPPDRRRSDSPLRHASTSQTHFFATQGDLKQADIKSDDFADYNLRQRLDDEGTEKSPVRSALKRDIEPAPSVDEEAPIVSPATDAAVATSFNALFASQLLPNQEALAEMAREMLRPMLKAWLDDNLPVMVERLVRAEIERVARGGR